MDQYQELYRINRLTDEEASAVGTSVSVAGDVATKAMDIFGKVGDAATGGLGAILTAVTGVFDAVGSTVSDVMSGVQDAVSVRRKITADEMKNFLDTKTTEWTNLPFMLIGGAVIVLLLYVKSKK